MKMISNVSHHVHKGFAAVWRSLFPPYCMCCKGRLLGNEQYVCSSCMLQLPRPSLGEDAYDNAFVRRFWGTLPIGGGVAVFSYFPGGELVHVIHGMKYYNKPDVCRFMGRMMAYDPLVKQLLEDAEILIPVPITSARRSQRGYNQSELMCEGISSIAGTELVTDSLQRISFEESQTALEHTERADNIRNAFELGNTERIEGRHVVIVDDIVTTGATMLECAMVLSKVPGIKISILALAWTSGHWR